MTAISSSVLDRECPGRLHTDERKADAPSPVEDKIFMAFLGVTDDQRLISLASLSIRWSLFWVPTEEVQERLHASKVSEFPG